MATQWISPTWRMPTDTESPAGTGNNQSKVDNYSLDFNGSSQYVNCGNDAFLNWGTGNGSVSCWFKTTQVVTGAVDLVINGGFSTGGKAYLLYLDGDEKVGFYLDDNASPTTPAQSSGSVDDGNWHHVVGVRESGNIKLYLDGSLADTQTDSTGDIDSTDPLIIGAGMNASTGVVSNFFDGNIAQVIIYDSALSASQITDLYNSGTPVNPMALTPLPLAYYPLGGGSTGDAAVSSPNTLTVPNESVPGSTAFQTLGSGQLMDLGGSGLWSDILVGTNRTAIATLSYWIKGPFPSYHRQWEMGAANHDLRRVGTSQRFYYRAGAANTYQYYNMKDTGGTDIPGVDLDSSNWIHVVLVFPSGSVIDSSGTAAGGGVTDINLFINGVECQKSSTSASGGYNTAWGSGGYGIQNYNNEQLTPRSNVQIWNSVLTSGEITTLYNNGTPYLGTQPQASNLKGWWRMNVDTSAWDGSDWIVSDTSVEYKNSLNFDGASKITTPLDISDSSFTTSVWVKANSSGYAGGGKYVPFGVQSTDTGGVNRSINQLYNGGSTGGTGLRPAIQIYEFGTTNFQYWFANSYNFLDGGWYNVVWTRDSSTSKIQCYVNGQLQTFTQFNGAATTNALQDHAEGSAAMQYSNVTIGAFKNNSGVISNNYLGQVSNCTIFNTVLTPTQITTIYNNGLPETTPSSSPISWWKLNNTTTGIQDSIGSNNGTNDGAVASGIAVSQNNGTSSGMTTANLVTSDLSRSIPYSSYSMYMTGSTDDTYFDLGTDIVVGTSGNTTYSWSIWVKPVHDGITDVVVFGDSGATDDGSLVLSHSGSTWTAKLEQTGTDLESSAGAIADNTWAHIAIVVDSTASTKKMYINGQEDTAAGGTGAGPDGTIKNINSSNTSNQYTGYVSNWAFWTSALSDDNILSIYNSGVPNSLTSLSPTHWWSMSGDSYYDGSAWICPDLIGSNNLTGVNDSGQELIGDGPGSTVNGVATDMDIPGNLEGNAPNSTNNSISINMTAVDRVSGAGNVPG